MSIFFHRQPSQQQGLRGAGEDAAGQGSDHRGSGEFPEQARHGQGVFGSQAELQRGQQGRVQRGQGRDHEVDLPVLNIRKFHLNFYLRHRQNRNVV